MIPFWIMEKLNHLKKDKTGHKEKFNKTVGIDGKKVDYGYLPYSLQLEFLRDSSEKAQRKK